MKKENFFYLIIVSFIIFLIYILSGIYGYIEYKRYYPFLFNNSKDLKFHYKYSDKINHLRSFKVNGKTTDYLYNFINSANSKSKVLFLGDSWFDQINMEEYSKSMNKIKNFSSKNNLNIINGGIYSYSPSLMHLQLKILKDDFNIQPTTIIIHIDQTDIGDESCRYKERKIFDEKGNLIAVNRFDFDKGISAGEKIYKYSEIKLQRYSITKFIELSNYTISYFIRKNIFRISTFAENGWRTSDQRNYYKCRFKVIKSFLDNKNDKANIYFKETLRDFFDYLDRQESIKQIIISTFPHRDHIKGIYKNNVSSLVDEVLENYEIKFQHINFSKSNYEEFELDKMYIPGDEASHLTPEYHNKIFIEKIISEINF